MPMPASGMCSAHAEEEGDRQLQHCSCAGEERQDSLHDRSGKVQRVTLAGVGAQRCALPHAQALGIRRRQAPHKLAGQGGGQSAAQAGAEGVGRKGRPHCGPLGCCAGGSGDDESGEQLAGHRCVRLEDIQRCIHMHWHGCRLRIIS